MALTVNYVVQSDGDFQTNTFENGQQLAPDVLGLSGGGFVCAYNNGGLDDGFVTLDFYDADRDGIAFQVANLGNENDTDAIGQPKLAELANGNVVVVWDDNNTGANDAGPQASIYSPTGAVVAEDVDIFAGRGSTAFKEIDVAALANGNFVVSYAFGGNIFFRIIGPTGVQQGAAFTVHDIAAIQEDTQITALSDGGFAITWTDTGPDVILSRIFEADGAVRTGAFSVSLGNGDRSQSSVAALHNGNFAVVYTDTTFAEGGGGTGAGIGLSIMNGGNNLVLQTQVNVDSPGDEADADVAVLANGFIAVTWTRPNPVSDDTRCRVFDQDGDAVTGEFSLAVSGEDELASAVSALLDGTFIASWQDATTDGSQGQITSQVTEIRRTVIGDAADDTFTGDLLRDNIDGGGGDDRLDGGAGDDLIDGGGENDTLIGGSGDDAIEGGLNADTLSGGVGDDLLYAASAASVDGSIDGDLINAGNGHDEVFGSAGADVVLGLGDKDTLDGRAGDDTLNGGTGKDRLIGGLGADELTGGGDKDVFAFNSVADSAAGAEDLITDLGNQEIVDLNAIDAKAGKAGDQAFELVNAFTGKQGELVVDFHTTGAYAGFTTIQGDVDGDGGADFTIKVNGDKHNFDSFVL